MPPPPPRLCVPPPPPLRACGLSLPPVAEHGHFSLSGHTPTHIYTLAFTTLLNPISPCGAARRTTLRMPSMSPFESRQNNQLAAAESKANESVSSGGC